MTSSIMKAGLVALALLASGTGADAAERAASKVEAVAARMADPNGGIIIVAHRGCHNVAPENSFAALDKCIELGIDVVEIDIRRTRDGYLVLMHDDSVDRTTDGTGKLSALTLEQVRALRLRDSGGGADRRITGERVVTLEEMLERAGEQIMLCLDIKDGIHAEVLAAVHRAGASKRVFIQPGAGFGSVPLASIPPYDQMPIFPALMASDELGSDLPEVLMNQSSGSRRPWGYALPWRVAGPVISQDVLAELATKARAVDGRLFANTMAKGTFIGYGGDSDALRDPAGVWGRLYRAGVSMFQTDEPEALAAFRGTSFSSP